VTCWRRLQVRWLGSSAHDDADRDQLDWLVHQAPPRRAGRRHPGRTNV